jgi:hypothetical protein
MLFKFSKIIAESLVSTQGVAGLDNIQNTKENQKFNTFDVLSIMACLILVIGVSYIFYKNHIKGEKTSEAKNYAEKLAQELVQSPVNSAQENDRFPASVSQELDPWGGEYKSNIIRNAYGQPIYVMVISAGPDHKFDTEIPNSASFSQSQIENLKVVGDDVGSIKSFR